MTRDAHRQRYMNEFFFFHVFIARNHTNILAVFYCHDRSVRWKFRHFFRTIASVEKSHWEILVNDSGGMVFMSNVRASRYTFTRIYISTLDGFWMQFNWAGIRERLFAWANLKSRAKNISEMISDSISPARISRWTIIPSILHAKQKQSAQNISLKFCASEKNRRRMKRRDS